MTLLYSCGIEKFATDNIPLASAIPETAIFGIYSEDLTQLQNGLAGSEVIGEKLEDFLTLQRAKFLRPDSLNIGLKEMSISWHSISGSDLAPLLLFKPLKSVVPSKIPELLGLSSSSLESKIYNDYEIWSSIINESQVVWLSTDEVIAISTNELLIEDVVRSLNEEEARLLKDAESDRLKGSKFFYNGKRHKELVAKTTVEDKPFVLEDQILLLDFEIEGDRIRFDGEAIGPNSAAKANDVLFGLSFMPLDSKGLAWKHLEGSNELNLRPFYASLSYEVFDKTEYLFLFEVENENGLREALRVESECLLASEDSTIYSEEYANELIGFVPGDTFSKVLEDQSDYLKEGAFYSVASGLLLLSPSADVLRASLAAHFDERTFGQSVEQRVFFDELIDDSYETSILNYNSSPKSLKDGPYSGFVSSIFDQLSRSIIQVNATSNNYLISGQIQYFDRNQAQKVSPIEESNLYANAFLDKDAVTRQYLLRNHNNDQREVIVQDKLAQLYQIDLQGNINWKVALDGTIHGGIYQVDYYNNRKLQYLMVTDSLVHIIDRNGKEIEGFPKPHGITSQINGLNMVDYDNTKRYRYLVTANRGEIYLFDKEVKLLDNWSPLNIDAMLASTPYHSRIGGKDFFVVVENTNKIHLLNRRGQAYPGFPVNLSQRIAGDHYFKKSPSLSISELVVVSADGLQTRVSLLGKQLGQKQFLKESNNDTYQLVSDVLGNGYLVIRNGEMKTVILDEEGGELFDLPLLSNDVVFSYYKLSGNSSALMAWDTKSKKVSLYDMAGNRISETLDSSQKPSLLYFSREGNYQLFTIFNNEIRVHQLQVSK